MIYWIFALLAVLTSVSVWIYKIYFPAFIKQKAQGLLVNLLFPEGKVQQDEVLNIFHQLTNHRFSNEHILDYFIKIKGLQTLDLSIKTNFWIKKYLLSPTDVKLNYFEQVRFYETFLNYPKSLNVQVKFKTVPESSVPIFSGEENSDRFLQREYA